MAPHASEAGTPESAPAYLCFLVRCRLAGGPGPNGLRSQPAWRFTVQQAGTRGARRSFTCFDDVVAHMRAELASCGAVSSGALVVDDEPAVATGAATTTA